MIHIKNEEEIALMRKSCRLAAEVLLMIEPYIQPGVTTDRLNDLCHEFIVANGAVPSPLNYKGFPKSICCSVNEEICHGIPSDRKLGNGDIVNLDITVYLDGFHGDTNRTFFVGSSRARAQKLVDAGLEALHLGIGAVRSGAHLGNIGAAIQRYIEGKGYSVVREFCGHGIGREFHEEPQVLHFGRHGEGVELKKGMIFTIEPMINEGTHDLRILSDNWTAVTKDGSLSCQYEHTVLVTDTGCEVLTRLDGRTSF